MDLLDQIAFVRQSLLLHLVLLSFLALPMILVSLFVDFEQFFLLRFLDLRFGLSCAHLLHQLILKLLSRMVSLDLLFNCVLQVKLFLFRLLLFHVDLCQLLLFLLA